MFLRKINFNTYTYHAISLITMEIIIKNIKLRTQLTQNKKELNWKIKQKLYIIELIWKQQ